MTNTETPKSLVEKLFELKQKSIVLLRNERAFNYQYADLSQIQDKIAPELETLKLLVMHKTKDEQVITQIINVENPSEYEESSISIGKINTTREWDSHKRDKEGNILETVHNIEVTEQDPQAVGSIITYYRRYNLLQLLDLKTEDNDWASASPRAKNAPIRDDVPQIPKTPSKPYITSLRVQTFLQDYKEGKIQVASAESLIEHAKREYTVAQWAKDLFVEWFANIKK